MKKVIDYLKDSMSLFLGFFWIWPFNRFDSVNADTIKRSDPFHGHTALVTEIVTTNTGQVKYNGTYWKARLTKEFEGIAMAKGEEVGIVEAKGNGLVVKPKEKS